MPQSPANRGTRGSTNPANLMPARQKLPKETIVAITTNAAAGSSHRNLIAKYPDVSDRTIRLLRQNGVTVEEWREEVSRGLRGAVDETLAAYRAALAAGKVPPNNLALSVAILIDKADKLDARQVTGATQVNVMVNDYGQRSREEIMADLRIPELHRPLLLEKSVNT